MSDDTERQLHDQLVALGTIEPSAGLADAALREAKQRRRRGIAAIAAAAAVVLAIAIAVPLSVRHNSSGPTAPPPGPPQRNVVISYQTFARSDPDGTLTVLDPKTGKYVPGKLSTDRHAPFDVSTLVVSPDGQQYASSNGKHVGTVSDVINDNVAGFHTLDTGQTAGQPASWSPDSSRLLIAIQGVNLHFSLSGFRMYDVRTKKLGSLIHLQADDVSSLAWAASDTEVIGFAGQKLRFFDLDGKLRRTVTLPKHVDALGSISPDGRYLALATALFDLRTGRTIPLQLPRKQEMAPAPLGWLDGDHYAVDWAASNGKSVNHRLLVFTNSGKLVKSINPPYGTSALPGTGGKSVDVEMQLGYGADYPANSGLRL
jgi:WD40 repeat protein